MPGQPDQPASGQHIRVALIRDFLEEGWPSMDLVGDMLSANLAEHCNAQVIVAQLCPIFRRPISLLPLPARLARNGDRWINRFVCYPRWLERQRGKHDVYHIVDHSYSQLVHSLPPGRTVVTCHDVDTFRCLLTPQLEKRPFWFRRMTQQILTGLQKAAHVIAVSSATLQELLKQGIVPADRITVISNGVHPSCSPEPNPRADRTASDLTGTAPAGAPILLSVGSTQPRKRLDVLLKVFAAVRVGVPHARLVRVGGLTAEHQRLAEKLGIQDAMVCVPFVDRDVLAALYRAATLLVHTAESEGFGLPVVEAMASGCVVVASDLPVLREVAGNAAFFCPVADLDAWTATVTRLIGERAQDDNRWQVYRGRSLENAARFSWAENARQTALVYQKVMDLQEHSRLLSRARPSQRS